jgi:hypothetical protein
MTCRPPRFRAEVDRCRCPGRSRGAVPGGRSARLGGRRSVVARAERHRTGSVASRRRPFAPYPQALVVQVKVSHVAGH